MREPLLPGLDWHGGPEALITPEALAFIGALQRCFGGPLLAAAAEMTPGAPGPRERAEAESLRVSLPAILRDRRADRWGPATADFLDRPGADWRVAALDHPDGPDPVSGLAAVIARTRTLGHGPMISLAPRALPGLEPRLGIDGAPALAALFDFGLYFYHGVRSLAAAGRPTLIHLSAPPNLASAEVWAEIFTAAQEAMAILTGTIRATLVVPASAEPIRLTPVLVALAPHLAGLALRDPGAAALLSCAGLPLLVPDPAAPDAGWRVLGAG